MSGSVVRAAASAYATSLNEVFTTESQQNRLACTADEFKVYGIVGSVAILRPPRLAELCAALTVGLPSFHVRDYVISHGSYSMGCCPVVHAVPPLLDYSDLFDYWVTFCATPGTPHELVGGQRNGEGIREGAGAHEGAREEGARAPSPKTRSI